MTRRHHTITHFNHQGIVDIYTSYNLARVKRVRNAHSTFITGLEFLPTSEASAVIRGFREASVVSISVDHKVRQNDDMTHLMIMFPGLYPSRTGDADSQLLLRYVPRDPRPGRHLHPLKLRRSLDHLCSHYLRLSFPANSISNAFLVRLTTSCPSGYNIFILGIFFSSFILHTTNYMYLNFPNYHQPDRFRVSLLSSL